MDATEKKNEDGGDIRAMKKILFILLDYRNWTHCLTENASTDLPCMISHRAADPRKFDVSTIYKYYYKPDNSWEYNTHETK